MNACEYVIEFSIDAQIAHDGRPVYLHAAQSVTSLLAMLNALMRVSTTR